jgi:hypothetical protein
MSALNPNRHIGHFISPERAKREIANPNGVTEKRVEKNIGVYELRELVERMSEVSWEAWRAHTRSELDVSTSDMRCPLKWASLPREQQQAIRIEVLKFWGGAEMERSASFAERITFQIVSAYKAVTPTNLK